MNHSPVVAFINDEEGRLLYMNEVMEQKFQLGLEQMFGKTTYDWLSTEGAERAIAVDRQVLATVSRTSRRSRAHAGRLDAGLVDDEFCIGTSDGRKMLGGVAMDVGEQRRAERALQESERHFRELFDERR